MNLEPKFRQELNPIQELNKDVLVVMNGPEDGRIFEIDKPQMSIGRLEENDISLRLDMFVSRRHAILTKEGSRYYIADVGSTHGTEIEGKKIHDKTEFNTEDSIIFGTTMLKLRLQSTREV